MNSALFVNLGWLPAPAADFTARCRALAEHDHVGREAVWLASHSLDESQLNRLAKAFGKAKTLSSAERLAPLSTLKLGIVSNATTHLLVPTLIATALRYGLALECVEADYDQAVQTALASDSIVNCAECDVVLVAIDHRGLPLGAVPGDAKAAHQAVSAAFDHLQLIREGFKRNGKTVCILQTLARPVEAAFGSLDRALPGTERQLIDEFNRELSRNLLGSQDLLLDVAHIAETVGLAEWHDPTLWNMAKLPVASSCLPLYADHVCRLLSALRGKSKKCLILDLDNTVWGGVIGDDGLEGIVIGQGDATGEAFLDVQRTAMMLRDRGVVLAVSSKNNDDVARLPFQKHPEMLLREEHLAVFQANWNDKATNIKAIANELSLGLESMVFLDDNPAERSLVRQTLPEVAVPELPDDPALYARTLLAAGYFEAVTFSEEDRKRAGFYQDNSRRVALQAQAADMEAYLASLDMTITFQPFDEIGRSRITQLINKSNQFNLTTRRYTEAQVEEAEKDADAFTLQVRLADSFGDNGMISVVVCRRSGDDWHVDTWLMSCRVLGRKVEHAVLQEIVMHARQAGVRRILGAYLPTERNKLVVDHYAKLGFEHVETHPDGASHWQLEVASYSEQVFPMKVVRPGFGQERSMLAEALEVQSA